MIVPTAPGASIDVIGRILAERMRKSLAQPIIIENIGGRTAALPPPGLPAQSPTATRLSWIFLGTTC
jgi:hypothetical protein